MIVQTVILTSLPPSSQDRVMINRMDNICEAVLKGKWPVNRRHIFDFPSNLLPGHGSTVTTAAVATVTESSLQRRSLAELTMAGIHTPYSGSEDKTLSPQVHVSVCELTTTRSLSISLLAFCFCKQTDS